MPWETKKDHPKCSGVAVVKSDTGELVACHTGDDAQAKADRQVRALYASERSLPNGADAVVRALPELDVEGGRGDGALATITGHAARFGVLAKIDSVKEGKFFERMKKGAFENAIVADRERTKMLFEHGTHPQAGRIPLGPLDELVETDEVFRYSGPLLDTEFNRSILPGLRNGLFGSSFLGRIHYGEPFYPKRATEHNPEMWPEVEGIKVRPLMDVGPTAFPVYLGTTTGARSMTDEFLMAHFTDGEGLQKLAAWAKDQSEQKIQMPMKNETPDPAPAPVPAPTPSPAPTPEPPPAPGPAAGVGGNDNQSENVSEPDPPAKPLQDTPVVARKEPEVGADIDRYTSLETLAARRDEVKATIGMLKEQYSGRAFDADGDKKWKDANDEFDALVDRIEDLQKREARAAQVFGQGNGQPVEPTNGHREPVVPTFQAPKSRIPDNIYDMAAYRSVAGPGDDIDRLYIDGARRAVEVETFVHPDFKEDDLRENVTKLLETVRGKNEEESGRHMLARHILGTGSDLYRRAWTRYLATGDTSSLDPQEAQALHQGRALSLTGASGGFAVPFELDPTILGTSNGTINFIRQIARTVNITVDEWRGITSAGITASFQAEATETTDNAPTLVQPTVSTEKAQAFIPFSIEIGMDWDGIQAELTRALGEAKDELEAAKFMAGTGTNEPFGVLTGTTNTVAAAAGQTFTLANLYALLAALPPRYRNKPSTAFMGNLLVANRIRQFDTAGGAALWVTLGDDVPDRLLGKAWYESSDMADVATSVKFLLFGDFSRYLIVDRVGLSVETIPHLVGTNHRPTGQRGLYAYWRVGAKVLDANAFRALLGTA